MREIQQSAVENSAAQSKAFRRRAFRAALVGDSPRLRAWCRGRSNPDAHVYRGCTFERYDDRIDVHLVNLRTRLEQLGDREQRAAERRLVGRPGAAVSAQQRAPSHLVHHLLRVGVGQRTHAEDGIGEEFHEHTAGAGHDHRTQRGIVDAADDHFDACRQHPLHEYPVQPVRQRLLQRAERGAHRG